MPVPTLLPVSYRHRVYRTGWKGVLIAFLIGMYTPCQRYSTYTVLYDDTVHLMLYLHKELGDLERDGLAQPGRHGTACRRACFPCKSATHTCTDA
jgi:hypothetical protein